MPNLEVHLIIFDEELSKEKGRWGDAGYAFSGTTVNQRETMAAMLRLVAKRLNDPSYEENNDATEDGQQRGEDHRRGSGPAERGLELVDRYRRSRVGGGTIASGTASI